LEGQTLMSGNLFDKMKNFLMPPPEEYSQPQATNLFSLPRKNRTHHADKHLFDTRPQLVVNNQVKEPMRIFIEEPLCFDDAQKYADLLRKNAVVFINYHKVNIVTKQRIGDFMNGVCYTLGGSVQVISEQTVIYACANVDVDKVLCSYSVPSYVRVK
jgi:cell division inhibitor SepF